MLILCDFDFVKETMLIIVSHTTKSYTIEHGKIVQHFLILGYELIVIELVTQLLHQVFGKWVVDVGLLVLEIGVAVG